MSTVKTVENSENKEEIVLNSDSHQYRGTLTSQKAREIRAKRTTFNRSLPPLKCDGCAFSASCPQMKPGFECAFTDLLTSHKINPSDIDSLTQFQAALIELDLSSVQLGAIQQRLAGGVIDDSTSRRIDAAFEKLQRLKEEQLTSLSAPVTDSVKIEATGGIVARLFGSLGNQPKAPPITESLKKVSLPVTEIDMAIENPAPSNEIDLDTVIDSLD